MLFNEKFILIEFLKSRIFKKPPIDKQFKKLSMLLFSELLQLCSFTYL